VREEFEAFVTLIEEGDEKGGDLLGEELDPPPRPG